MGSSRSLPVAEGAKALDVVRGHRLRCEQAQGYLFAQPMAADNIERLIRQALSGMALTHVPNPPPAIPVKLNHQYFRLDRAGADWEAVQRARNLAVYVPEDFPAPQLELVLVLPPRS